MTAPLLSIVVPTHGRPQYLAAALDSALAAHGADTEVIVVPNGPDASWREVTAAWAGDARVRVEPIATAHGCAARNHGLALARGEFVRFLDDDDLLYAEGAREQLALIRSSAADVASAPIELLREDGSAYARAEQPATADFIAAVMSGRRVVQVTAHVFRREWARVALWNESLPYAQDVDWVFALCRQRDPRWVKSAAPAGGWRRHTGRRTTIGASLHRAKQTAAEGILRLAGALEASGRLGDERRAAAASGLWDGVHSALFLAPRYWRGIAAHAERLAPGSRPDTAFFRHPLTARLGLTPLQWEQLLAPKRMLTYGMERALLALGLSRTW